MKLQLCFIVATFSVSVLALTDEQRAKLIELTEPCRAKTGASLELTTRAKNGDFADDPKLKATMFCVLKKIGLVDENGVFASDKLKIRLKAAAESEEEAETVFNKCVEKKESPEETVFLVSKCLHKHLPKYSPVE